MQVFQVSTTGNRGILDLVKFCQNYMPSKLAAIFSCIVIPSSSLFLIKHLKISNRLILISRLLIQQLKRFTIFKVVQ